MHLTGNHARISPGPGDSRAQQVLGVRRGSSHLEAPEATKSQSSSDPGRLQGLGGRTQVLLSEPHPEAAPMWPGPRRWDIPVPSILFPPPRLQGGSPVTSHSDSARGHGLKSRRPRVIGAQATGTSLPPQGLALRVPGASDLAVGLFCQEERVAGQCVEQRQAGPQGCFCSFSSLHTPG